MKLKKYLSILMSSIMLLSSLNVATVSASETKLIAFPGAEGGGMYTQGARANASYSIYHVTNLKDSGSGSFRDAVSYGNRIIVFDVSGTIMLESQLKIRASNLTILGQTAPGEGVCVAGADVQFLNCNNIILRYMRFRAGDVYAGDALSGKNCNNIIIDHCSVSWSTDECFSWYGTENFTAQWNIISEALRSTSSSKNGAHGYGGLWGGKNASFHHNLLASNDSRNPRISSTKNVTTNPDDETMVDVRNNVVYNWKTYAGYGGENGVRVNFVNNYYKPTDNSTKKLFYSLYSGNAPIIDGLDNQSTTLYLSGNVMEGEPELSADNWLGLEFYAEGTYWIKRENIENKGVVMLDNTPTEIEVTDNIALNNQYLADYPVVTQTAEDAYSDVLKYAGASYRRDVIDERVVNDVINGTYTNGSNGSIGFIDSQEDVGGWCYLYEGTVETDTDADGIPDEWEDKNGLDKTNKDDAVVLASSGYTNIEEYANSLIENIQPKQVNRKELNLAILRSKALDLNAYYAIDIAKINKQTKDAISVYGNSTNQQEIDEVTLALNTLLDNTDIMYKPVLKALIAEINTMDLTIYTIESCNALNIALDKANADLLLEEDNALLKADYKSLKSAYESLETSLLPDLQAKLETINTKYIQNENLYTEISITLLKEIVLQAQQLIDSNTYTNDSISEIMSELDYYISALEKIDFTSLNKYISIIENGVLGVEYLTNDCANMLAELKAEGETIANSNPRDNVAINEFITKIINTLKNDLKYVDNFKTVKFSEDFENPEDVVCSGSATYITEENNTCAQPKTDFQLDFPIEVLDDNTYLSTDFKLLEKGSSTIIHSYEFEEQKDLALTVDYYTDSYKLEIYILGKASGLDGITINNIPIKINEWNNITSNYNSATGNFKIYLNNMLIYNGVITNKIGGLKELSCCGVIIPYYKMLNPIINNKSSYIDNIKMFSFEEVERIYIYGDADASEDLSAADAAVVLQKVLNSSYIMPLESVLPEYMQYLDVDADGQLSAADSAQILQKVLNNSFKMPVEE